MDSGALYIVGTGICVPGQMTHEAEMIIRGVDVVIYNVGKNELFETWLASAAKRSINLYGFYAEGKPRDTSYAEMVETIVAEVRAGRSVAGVFYGHPGVFVGPGFDALKKVRAEGHHAVMLPGVSAVDCMFADLEFDPAVSGCLMIEATDLVMRLRTIDTSFPLIVWQAGVVGEHRFVNTVRAEGVDLLKDRLLEIYPGEATVVNYVAATIPGMKPFIQRGTIDGLKSLRINQSSTLLIPPVEAPRLNRGALDRVRAIMEREEADRSLETAG